MPRFTYGGQALIEGVMMRGRDAVAVALRHPDGRIVYATEQLESGLPRQARGQVAVRARARRALRDPRDGHQVAHPQRGPPGRGRGRRDRQGRRRADARHHRRPRDRAVLHPAARRRHVHGRQHRERHRPAPRGGAGPGRHLHRLSRPDQPHAGHPPRVHVPRRRAHDDPRARGRQAAGAGRDPQVPDGPSALRHGVPRRRDPALDPRLQPRRPAEPRS